MSGQYDGRRRFFFNYADKVGFKLIPKCGSTSVRQHLGMDERPISDFLRCPYRVVVVREPASRLRSVYTGFSDSYGLKIVKIWQQAYGFKPGQSLEEFLDLVLAQPDAARDWHWQSVTHQISEVAHAITHVVPLDRWDAFDFLPDLPAKPLNQTTGALLHTRQWTDEELARIREAYAADYELWESGFHAP